ncbi:spore coat protein YsxE [bacterium LRH843]|nr:spore coat protein YsxE [bacterium LRH843]
MNRVQSLYESILFYYDLYPGKIEDYGKVKKITTNRGIFALKETMMTPHQADEFIHSLRKLTKLGFNQSVPIYPTKFGEYILSIDSQMYYLMPWIEATEYTAKESREEKLASQLGVIHRLTVETVPFLRENIDESFQQLVKIWEMRRLDLNRFADLAERKTYMSPFELTFLTHAHMLDRMAENAQEHLQKWYDLCIEKGRYRTVLCHGRMQRSHALFSPDNEPLLLNFERASIDTPARDIANFCMFSFPNAYWTEEEVVKWFMRYERHLPLLEDEKHLICAYLNFPEPISYVVEVYATNRESMSELEHVQRLEKRLTSMRKVQRLTQKLIITQDQEHSS